MTIGNLQAPRKPWPRPAEVVCHAGFSGCVIQQSGGAYVGVVGQRFPCHSIGIRKECLNRFDANYWNRRQERLACGRGSRSATSLATRSKPFSPPVAVLLDKRLSPGQGLSNTGVVIGGRYRGERLGKLTREGHWSPLVCETCITRTTAARIQARNLRSAVVDLPCRRSRQPLPARALFVARAVSG